MYLGRHYIKKENGFCKNRFQYIVEAYDQTIFIEETLHRLVEVIIN